MVQATCRIKRQFLAGCAYGFQYQGLRGTRGLAEHIRVFNRAGNRGEQVIIFPQFSEEEIRQERKKARQLRKTRWWRRKCASGRCYYCGALVGSSNLTMDHLVPLARGGRSIRANLVPACKACNNKKKSSLVFEWDDYVVD